MYDPPYDEDSKNQVKKLTKAVIALFLVLVLTIGAIVGLVVVVVEGAKETKTSSSVRVAEGKGSFYTFHSVLD